MANPLGRLVALHKALGHPLRLRIAAMLHDGPLCVCQMTGVLRKAASTVSEHLADLKQAGIVAETKTGRWVEYRIAEDPVATGALLAVWESLSKDADVRADALVLRELRRVSLDDLCRAELDLARVGRARLAQAVARAEDLRRGGGTRDAG